VAALICATQFGPPEFGRFALANSERGVDENRAFWRNEPTLQKCNSAMPGRRATIVESPAP
jgi:hypothetical protein